MTPFKKNPFSSVRNPMLFFLIIANGTLLPNLSSNIYAWLLSSFLHPILPINTLLGCKISTHWHKELFLRGANLSCQNVVVRSIILLNAPNIPISFFHIIFGLGAPSAPHGTSTLCPKVTSWLEGLSFQDGGTGIISFRLLLTSVTFSGWLNISFWA